MSQNPLTLPTSGTLSGTTLVTDINSALDTLNTINSGAGAPASPEAHQLWFDTTNNLLKKRNAANTAWIVLGATDETNNLFYARGANVPECGQLRLASSSSLVLMPFGGNQVIIAGTPYTIPVSGISLGSTGVMVNGVSGSLAAGQTYYVSVYNNAGTLTLAYWALGTYTHMEDTTTGNVGVEVISSSGTPNSLHSLVGIATYGSSGFVDTVTNRFVRSWFNRINNTLLVNPGTAYSTSSGSAVEISTAYRIGFVAFSDDFIVASANGGVAGNTVGMGISTYLGFYGTPNTYPQAYALIYDVNYAKPLGLTYPWHPGEGYSFVSLFGAVAGGTATWPAVTSLSAILSQQN